MHERQGAIPSDDVYQLFTQTDGERTTFLLSPRPEPLLEAYGELPSEDRANALYALMRDAPQTIEGWRAADVIMHDRDNPISAINAVVADVASRDEVTAATLCDKYAAALGGEVSDDVGDKLTPDLLRTFAVRAWNTVQSNPRAVAHMVRLTAAHNSTIATQQVISHLPLKKHGQGPQSFATEVARTLNDLGETQLAKRITNAQGKLLEATQAQERMFLVMDVERHIANFRAQGEAMPAHYRDLVERIASIAEAQSKVALRLQLTVADVVNDKHYNDQISGQRLKPEFALTTAHAARTFDGIIEQLQSSLPWKELCDMKCDKLVLRELARRASQVPDEESFGTYADLLCELEPNEYRRSTLRSNREYFRQKIAVRAEAVQLLGFEPEPLYPAVENMYVRPPGIGVRYPTVDEAKAHIVACFPGAQELLGDVTEATFDTSHWQHKQITTDTDIAIGRARDGNGFMVSFDPHYDPYGRTKQTTGEGALHDLATVSEREPEQYTPTGMHFEFADAGPRKVEPELQPPQNYKAIPIETITRITSIVRRVVHPALGLSMPKHQELPFSSASDLANRLQRIQTEKGSAQFELPMDSEGHVVMTLPLTSRPGGLQNNLMVQTYGQPKMGLEVRGTTPEQALAVHQRFLALRHLTGRRR